MDADPVALMNELYVNIKVDREERPDLDGIYMQAVQAMTGQGGWPMSVFLTPEGQPFYGGTYYPPEPRYGMPSFVQVLHSVSSAYEKRKDEVTGQAQRLTDALAKISLRQTEGGSDLSTATLDSAAEQLRQYFDEYHGGFGSQPKFPQPMTQDFLLSQYARTGSLDMLMMVELTLDKMADGGIYAWEPHTDQAFQTDPEPGLEAAILQASPYYTRAIVGQEEGGDEGRYIYGRVVGVEQHRQPQPEKDDAVGQRKGEQRPVEPEEAGHGRSANGAGAICAGVNVAGVQVAQPVGVSTSGSPASSHISRRPAATTRVARVRATFSSVALSASPQAA